MSRYRSSSQTEDDFETSLENLELRFHHIAEKNPFMMVVLGCFNEKSSYTNDCTNSAGSKFDFLTYSFGPHQIINKPTDTLKNSLSNTLFSIKIAIISWHK